jgi:glutamine cyclotransferase
VFVAAGAASLYLALSADGRDGSSPPAGSEEQPRNPQPAPAAPERLRVRVLASFAHDPEAYTQGLLWEPSGFIESAGGYGRSFIRRWRPDSPLPLAQESLSAHLFAEGIAAVGDRVIQLTWREGVALYRDRATLAVLDRRAYDGEGWGLCWDGERLVMSDGTDTLTMRDAESFAPLGRVAVRAGSRPLADLNELECAEGWVYANAASMPQAAASRR